MALSLLGACSSGGGGSLVSDAGGGGDAGDGGLDAALADGAKSCTTVSDCGVNPGASCARTCQDGSNPCSYACVDNACVSRGCPNDVDQPDGAKGCSTVSDCGVNPGASCARTCQDGSNPCIYACIDNACVSRGCPNDVDADAGASECEPPCTAGNVCVKSQMYGGAYLAPDDAGTCPSAHHLEGAQCVADPTFACAPLPASCSGMTSCGCAGSLCTSGYACKGASSTQLYCELDAP